MDIAKLKMLCDIAETGNFTMTANRMGYTQSAVSHSVNKIEAELGFSLMNRTSTGIDLNSSGKTLMPYIRMVVAHYDRMRDVADSIVDLQHGTLSIGTYCSIAAQWLPSILKKYHEAFPNIEIKLYEGGIKEIESRLEDGSIDFAFISWQKNRNYQFITLVRDPLYAVFSKDFNIPEEYKKDFPVDAFKEYPFIALDPTVDNDTFSVLESAGVKPLVCFTCRDDHTIISMVKKNVGISLLPGLFIKGEEKELQTIEVKPCAIRTLGIAFLSEKNLPPAAKSFIDLASKMIKGNEI
ncbi:MAG TPA: LysR family transcriptional regulator [Mogibacterium sp.]|nr:LysR family transcriptional regulator [Mogibacterium sp.]